MELQDEKKSFDDRNFSAYLNRSYSDGFFPPPDIFGKQRHSNGYLQACNRNEKGISSKHDYLSVQGSIREESQVDKVSDKPPDLPHRKYITNKEEVTELDDVRIYYEIADSTKLRTSGQSDVKCFDQKEYVLRPADDDCLPQDKETNKPSANFPCSPCRMIILAAIIIILLIGLGCAAYFLWLRNTNEKSSSSQAPSTTIQPHCSPPGNTILKLSPDQIANRSWFLHSCEADIGFPAGDLSIEIMKSGDLEFRSLNVTIESSQDNKTSCEIHRKIEFGILFTSDMEKAIIRCKVMNTFFQDSSAFYSNNETISLIPGDACKDNTVSKSYRVHPTNCHYYIECNNTVPYGRACQYNNHCFGIYNVEVCSPCKDDFIICPETNDSCANAITPQKKTVNMTVHADQIVGLTSPRISNLHTCTGNIGNRSENIEVEMRLAGASNYGTIDPEYTTTTEATVNCTLIRVIKFWLNFTTEMHNATIRCKLTNDLNPDVSPAYSKPEMLFLVSGDACKDNTVSKSYRVHPTNCHYYIECKNKVPYGRACQYNHCFGIYNVEVCSPCKDDFIICPETNDSCANAITHQKKTVNMTVHADQIVGLTSRRLSNLHTCTGNIGHHSENIEVEMRLAGASNYRTIDPEYTTKTEATVNCTFIRVIKFWINFTTVMHNATIRCKLTNDLNPDVSPAYSKPEMLFLVSDDFCYQDYKFTKTNKYHHPTTCHRFVTCVRNHPHVNECPSNLCFSVEEDYCDYCSTVQTCPK
ncbi:uncharacterized protein [Mytilus edulis]|uniref:uncharacterized protein isoform X2 n=1 Tax=Mytilus edulis TaxID=6550 RepID=UPI0039F09FBC